jgi:hypothetical protein
MNERDEERKIRTKRKAELDANAMNPNEQPMTANRDPEKNESMRI